VLFKRKKIAHDAMMQETVSLKLEILEEAIRGRDGSALLKAVENLHYADIAEFQESLSDEDGDFDFLVKTLGPVRYADVLAELPEEIVERALGIFGTSEQRELFAELSDDDLTDVLRALPEVKRAQTLGILGSKDKELVRSLLKYDEETAGGWMTTQVGRVSSEMTVKKALESLRVNLESTDTLSRIFVTDDTGRLTGKIRLRDLAFNTWDTPICDIMQDVEHPVLATADQEEVAMMVKKYDLMVVPVVDESNRLLGVVTHDDAMEIAEQESTEDMERIAGLSGEQSESSYLYTSVLTHFKRRFWWLFGLALLAVASGYVMLRFEGVLSSIYLLSLFLPMVIAAGGNTGGQAATMVIRAMALGELAPGDGWRVAWKEFRLGALLGCLLSVAIFVICCFLLPVFRAPLPAEISYVGFGSAVAIALGLQVLFSTLIGALLPLFARAMKLDPAVIAAPAITTAVDVLGMVIYFVVAQAILQI